VSPAPQSWREKLGLCVALSCFVVWCGGIRAAKDRVPYVGGTIALFFALLFLTPVLMSIGQWVGFLRGKKRLPELGFGGGLVLTFVGLLVLWLAFFFFRFAFGQVQGWVESQDPD
jgi:hypothetical protein